LQFLATHSSFAPIIRFLPELLLVVGLAVIGLIILLSLRNRAARRGPQKAQAPARLAMLNPDEPPQQDFSALKADLYDTARDLTARMNHRAKQLEQLIADADDRIARLERLQPPDPVPRPAAPARPKPQIEPLRAEPVRAAHPAARAESLDPLTRSVYQLADHGCSPVEIARELNEQTGKVELILALRNSIATGS
jgi:hypothetical protein